MGDEKESGPAVLVLMAHGSDAPVLSWDFSVWASW